MRLPKDLKDLMEKIQKIFETGPKFVPPFSLERSMKLILRRFELNQNKSKQMKINDVFDHFCCIHLQLLNNYSITFYVVKLTT